MRYPEANHPRVYAAIRTAASWRERDIRDIQFRGVGLIPHKGAALLGYSHREAGDPRVAGITPERSVHIMSKSELWSLKYGYTGYLLQLVNAFPVDRDDRQKAIEALNYAGELLDEGKLVGIFGEETRYEDKEKKIVRGDIIGEIAAGIGMLAVKHDVGVHPVGISHLTEEERRAYGRDMKRVVAGLPDFPDPDLKFKAAVLDLTERHRQSLQVVFDEAQSWAREDAARAA